MLIDEQLAAMIKTAIFPILWEVECYNGITLRDVDDCRIGGRLDMGGRVERYEARAEKIAQAATAVLAREFEADRVRIGALEKIAAFAVHHVTCKLYQASYAVTFPSCSCGLDRLRAALKDHPHD